MNQEICQERVSVLGKTKSFLVNPSVFFEDNKKRNSWVILYFIIVISTAMTQGKVMSVATSSIDLSKNGGQDVAAAIGKISMLLGIISGGIGSAISILISALIILLCVRYILNGKISYKQVLSVYCFSNVPIVIQNFVNLSIYTSLGKTMALNNLMTLLITKINPLTIWFVILLIIGISVVSKVSIRKSATLVIILAFLSLTFTVGSYYVTSGIKSNTFQQNLKM